MRASAATSRHVAPHAGRSRRISAEADAWTAFWREQDGDSPCLRAAPAELRDLLSDHWARVAAALPNRTKVLDIGCGSGIVGKALVRAEPSLHVVGIDAAQVRAPRAGANVRILSGIKIEDLPFVDGCCGAAVSQFGYEYGDIHAAADELARVLRPGGQLSFIVHHSESAIVRGDRIHNKALRAATGENVRIPFRSGNAIGLSGELAKLQREFPQETTLWLLARGLLERIAGTPEQRERLWKSVKTALAPDRILSDALEASCVSPTEIEAWLCPLHQTFDVDRPSILHIKGEPLAWKIEGRRKIR